MQKTYIKDITKFNAWTGDANHSDKNTNLPAKGETHPPQSQENEAALNSLLQ